MEFTYNQDLRLNDEDRLLNPLGFRVMNYRVDNDFAPSPAPPPISELGAAPSPSEPTPMTADQAVGMGAPAGVSVPEAAASTLPAEPLSAENVQEGTQ